MVRTFLPADALRELVARQYGGARSPVALHRLAGGSKKGVYRLRLDDGTSAILYRWADDENFWPAADPVPDDPFTDASGAHLFAVAHAALTAAGVRVPRLLLLDDSHRFLAADLALVEDAGSTTLDALLTRDPAAAAVPLAGLGAAPRRMRASANRRYGRLADLAAGTDPAGAGAGTAGAPVRPAEDLIVDRTLRHLDAAAVRDTRIAAARDRIAAHVRALREPVPPRRRYGLVHGELGPEHVLVAPGGEPVLIDIEGLTYFDVEWEHAWLRMRFGDRYRALTVPGLDPARLELYRYAQVVSLIEGPLRIATTDFPDRQWMLDLAELNITRALAAL